MSSMSEQPKHAAHTESLAVAPPIVGPGHTFATVTDKISAVVLTRRTPLAFIAALRALLADWEHSLPRHLEATV